MNAQDPKTYAATGLLIFLAGFLFNLLQMYWVSNSLFTTALIFFIVGVAMYKKK